MRYRKKPIEVDAQQFWPFQKPWPEGVVEKTEIKKKWFGKDEVTTKYGVETLEGFMEAKQGDFIITGIAGERYPCKPDIFVKTYEDATVPLVDQNILYKMLNASAFHVTLNMNDTFGWATADAEDIAVEDIPKLVDVYQKFGHAGVDAFAALQRGYDVMDHPAVRTQVYYAAKAYLKDYEFHGEEYMMKKYREAHPESMEKHKKAQEEQEKEWNRKMEIYAAGHSFFKCIYEWFRKPTQ